ncbi:hypothetical protein ACJIZ3_009157 [Penstemon smallii]|uniref:Uncharacterized protein n=1 Tax=Penstemon smallii TaxID=265156 RepID=A0ABD3TCT6_9LAMI
MLRLLIESGNEPEKLLDPSIIVLKDPRNGNSGYSFPIAAVYILVPMHELRRRR